MSDDEFESPDDEIESDEEAVLEEGEEDEGSEERNAAVVAAAEQTLTSTAAHRKLRESLASDIEAFLSRGGQIQQVDDNVMADPPKKPQSNYGSRPI
ncbi:hypothetical protein [Parathalassolituus penaei]|uniref:Transcriptional regulator SutA RNAP-binding domain-containing protein n=1 Tax=Parathalassolituus penaei TaxID=2997323 RepID=A0A9X3IRZ4_9GAMM|nr:hypothetical protein [Parathalassolituus penaei]MCY0965782.1 hypothetical protein [Parathalassolituus penaei]